MRSLEELREKAAAWVEEGKRLGAAEVEVYVQDSTGLSVKAYQGEVESVPLCGRRHPIHLSMY